MRHAIHSIDPDEATSTFRTMSDDVVTAPPQATALNMLPCSAPSPLSRCCYHHRRRNFRHVSYIRQQHTREIGLRIALGAQPGDVLRVIVGYGLRLVLLGLCIGVAVALLVTRWMSSVLFDVKPTDPLTSAIVAVVLGTVAFLASYVPARRAMRVDPMSRCAMNRCHERARVAVILEPAKRVKDLSSLFSAKIHNLTSRVGALLAAPEPATMSASRWFRRAGSRTASRKVYMRYPAERGGDQ